MNSPRIKAIQQRIGMCPDDCDGFFGTRSIAACQAYLHSLMPTPNPWPDQSQASLRSFYGQPGDEDQLVNLKVSDVLYGGEPVKTLRGHGKVAASLGRIIGALAASPSAWVLSRYDGCFNFRNMRGGSLPSLHSTGAAIDFCSATNGNSDHWPDVAEMPLAVIEIFAREGWLSAGASWGRDAMHFQATR